MNFGKRLRELRKTMNLNQEQLGEIVNVSKSTVSKYELNTLQPSLETLLLISQYFNVSIDYMLDNDINNPREVKSLKNNDSLDKLVENFDDCLLSDNISEEAKDYIVRKIQDTYWKSKDLKRKKSTNDKF